MALLLVEGFDQYSTDTELNRGGWTGVSNAVFNSSALNRHGDSSRSIQLVSNGSPVSHGFAQSGTTIIGGFAMNLVDAGPQTIDIFRFLLAGEEKIVLRTTSSGQLAIDRGATNLDITTGDPVFTQDVWYYVEVKVLMDNTVGTYEVKVDGQTVMSDTNVDTLNGTTAACDTVSLISSSTNDAVFDDVYVADASGSDLTDFAGDCRVETIVPDGAGNSSAWTPSAGSNWQNVDDMAPSDDDTTYNETSTAANEDLYTFAALTGDVGTVYGVVVSALVRKLDPGFREIRCLARNNVTTVQGASQALGTGYSYKNEIYENDPDGGGNWTEADVNSAEFGIRLHT